jgi:hypothetical protein
MSKHHHDEGGELHFEQISHHGVKYENRDLGARGIIAFLIVLIVSTAVLCAVVYGYYDYDKKHTAEEAPRTGASTISNNPTTQPNPTMRFPKPTLQPDDVADMYQMRANEDQILNSYGWVDQKNNIARIPVEEAMKAIAQQGLPTRPAAQPPATAQFGSGTDTVPGLAGGTRPVARQ